MWDAPWHWVVLALVVIALFGYKKLPDAARSLGRSLRIFRTEIKGMGEDDKARAEQAQPELPAAQPAQAAPPATPVATPVAPVTPAPPATDAEVPVQTAQTETPAG